MLREAVIKKSYAASFFFFVCSIGRYGLINLNCHAGFESLDQSRKLLINMGILMSQPEGEQQVKSDFGILKVKGCDLDYPLQPVYEGASVNVKHLGSLGIISLVFKKDLQRMIHLTLVIRVIRTQGGKSRMGYISKYMILHNGYTV